MHFTINREVILYPLLRVNTAIDQSPTIPVLSHVNLVPEADGIKLTGSNIQIEVSEFISDVEVVDARQINFPGAPSLEFCRRLPHGCNLKFTAGDNGLLVIETIDAAAKGGSKENESGGSALESRLELQVIEVSDSDQPDAMGMGDLFPKLNTGDWAYQFQMDRHSMQTLIRRTRHAMSIKENVRPFLEAMLFEMDGNEVRTVATDGHRLATNTVAVATDLGETAHRAIVPRKTIDILSKLLAELTSSVTISFNDSHIGVSSPSVSFVSKLMEGQYPDWRGAVPMNWNRVFRASRDELANVLTRVNILSIWDKKPVAASINVSGNTMFLHAESNQATKEKIDESIDVVQQADDHEGPLKFQVNCRYLLDIFEAMPDNEQVEFNLRDAQNSCLLRFPDDSSASFLVMLLKEH